MPDFVTLVKITDYFNVSVDFLLNSDDNTEVGKSISLSSAERALVLAYRNNPELQLAVNRILLPESE